MAGFVPHLRDHPDAEGPGTGWGAPVFETGRRGTSTQVHGDPVNAAAPYDAVT
jgi:hypothetical protein